VVMMLRVVPCKQSCDEDEVVKGRVVRVGC
jgi:hypothetical protein